MNKSCQNAPDVILLLDDDDEEGEKDDKEEENDVEIVFSNLDSSASKGFHNELIKISEEIKLLQAMCKQSVPRDFNKFKNQVQKMGHQFSYDVVESAWKRLVKKSNIFPNNVAPVCRVKPQTAVVSPLQGNTSNSSCPSSAPSRLGSVDKTVASTQQNTSSQEYKSILKNYKTMGLECSNDRESISSTLLVEDLDETSNSFGNSDPLSDSECDSDIVEKTQSCENKVTQKSSIGCKSTNKQHLHVNLEDCEEITADTRNSCSKLRSFRMKKSCFKKKKTETEVSDSTPTDSYLATNISDLSKKKENSQLKNESSKRKNSAPKVSAPNSPKAGVKRIAKSHVGVKAKIVRRKRSFKCKISETELKEFKKEQKRLKYQQYCELELQQLQKVHDRLVDVLIPKYYKKNLNTKD